MRKPVRLLHATNARNRLAIRRYGLLARSPFEHNYAGDSGIEAQPKGVYGTELSRKVTFYGRGFRKDIWKLDCSGLPREKDELVTLGWIVLCDVPPERLVLVKAEI